MKSVLHHLVWSFKKGSRIISVAFFLCCFIVGSKVGYAVEGKFVPEEGKVLLMVGQDKKSIENYISANGHTPAGFMVYTSLHDLDGLETPSDRGSGVQHAQYFLEKYHNSVLQIGLYLVGALDAVVEGKYDDKINQLGSWIDHAQVPVFLRIGYECDFPQNDYDPQMYIKAYQRIVNQLRAQGIKNVAFVWHATGHPADGKKTADWYPGNQYVDWIGLSFFYVYNMADYEAMAALAQEHHKPLMIAESTPSQLGVLKGEESWRKWYQPYFQFIKKHHVKAVSYINTDWNTAPMFASQAWGDSRIEENAVVKQKWLEEISKPKYLRAEYDIFKNLQW